MRTFVHFSAHSFLLRYYALLPVLAVCKAGNRPSLILEPLMPDLGARKDANLQFNIKEQHLANSCHMRTEKKTQNFYESSAFITRVNTVNPPNFPSADLSAGRLGD